MTKTPAIDFERISALIVDDNQHMRNLVRTILHSLGIKNVREVSDGADALNELQHFKANLLITDWVMEPLDGLDLTKLVRTSKDSPCPYIPILMMTGHSTVDNVRSARDAGIDEFIVKPISAKSMLDRILAIVNNPRIFVNTRNYFGPDRRRHLTNVTKDKRESNDKLENRPDMFN